MTPPPTAAPASRQASDPPASVESILTAPLYFLVVLVTLAAACAAAYAHSHHDPGWRYLAEAAPVIGPVLTSLIAACFVQVILGFAFLVGARVEHHFIERGVTMGIGNIENPGPRLLARALSTMIFLSLALLLLWGAEPFHAWFDATAEVRFTDLLRRSLGQLCAILLVVIAARQGARLLYVATLFDLVASWQSRYARVTEGEGAELPERITPPDEAALSIVHWSDLHLVADPSRVPAQERLDPLRKLESLFGSPGPQPDPVQHFHDAVAAVGDMTLPPERALLLLTGDITDVGDCAEWALFLDAIGGSCDVDRLDDELQQELRRLPADAPRKRLPPALRERLVLLPGNHDLNALVALWHREGPGVFAHGLRLLRMAEILDALQGTRCFLVGEEGRLVTLRERMDEARPFIRTFRDAARAEFERRAESLGLRMLASLRWRLGRNNILEAQVLRFFASLFPMVCTFTAEGKRLAVFSLNSVSPASHTLSNAFGSIPMAAMERLEWLRLHYRTQGYTCLYAMHHHLAVPGTGVGEKLSLWRRGLWQFLKDHGLLLQDRAPLMDFLCFHERIDEPTVLLHGHHHIGYVARYKHKDKTEASVTVVSAASTTLKEELDADDRPRFRIIHLRQAGRGLSPCAVTTHVQPWKYVGNAQR